MSMFDAAQRSELMAIAAQNRRELIAMRTFEADLGSEKPRSCSQCDGGGEVTWNPSPINDPQCAETATCPRCDGTGLVKRDRP